MVLPDLPKAAGRHPSPRTEEGIRMETLQRSKATGTKSGIHQNFPIPKTVKELRRFLGMINFVVLYLMQHEFKPHSMPFSLVQLRIRTHKHHRRALKHSTPARIVYVMHLSLHTDCDAKLSLVTDASDTSLGAVLQQYKDKAWEPLAFYSHKLSPAQRNYSPTIANS
ncbi:Transposon Tf2-8 polyprotein [Eumeta japonica]|uniref:Transposon Tf2-8 polyprotein n=1 Tax=Eumeta variegata TaxID=151549 RepID=A0A4C1UCH6_EUMVA|nr:Transposon Tf2-8 polyprotein [Eumeta japonica]